ncbi:MAG: hypothetical protein ABSG43_09965 [Solirubrobacteraceae bacterium]|jgi:hypothetical protein
MPNPNPLHYRDATGARHQVLARETAEGTYQVLDITVVETLAGIGEGREAAEAVARDYAAQHHHPAPTARPRRRDRTQAAA